MFSVPSAFYNLSTFCSSKFHEHCREVADGDIPPRIECSKVSHSVSIEQLGNLCINSRLLQKEVSMMLTEKDTDLWVWQSIYCYVSLAEKKYYFLPRPIAFLTKDIGHSSNRKGRSQIPLFEHDMTVYIKKKKPKTSTRKHLQMII